MVISLGVFPMGSSDLNMEPIRDRFELGLVLAKKRQVNMHRSTQCSTEVCGARSDIPEVLRVRELCYFLNLRGSSG
jgi:hypothetical protein